MWQETNLKYHMLLKNDDDIEYKNYEIMKILSELNN